MKKETKEKLSNLKREDVLSLIMFSLFKLKDIPEYSSISELAYLLQGKSLFNLMEYYGGQTIRIPTMHEFNVVLQSLLLFQYINLEHIEYSQAVKLLDLSDCTVKEIKECYAKVVDILVDYDFNRE